MSNENPVANDEGLRSVATELQRRRSKIAKAQRSFEVIVGAYDLVLADLRAAAHGESDPATCGETTAG